MSMILATLSPFLDLTESGRIAQFDGQVERPSSSPRSNRTSDPSSRYEGTTPASCFGYMPPCVRRCR